MAAIALPDFKSYGKVRIVSCKKIVTTCCQTICSTILVQQVAPLRPAGFFTRHIFSNEWL